VLLGGGAGLNKLYQVFMAQRLGNKGYRALAKNPLYGAIGRGLTFTWFAFSLLWFWSSWKGIAGFASALGAPLTIGMLLAVWGVATVVLAALVWAGERVAALPGSAGVLDSRYLRTATATLMITIVLAADFVLNSPAPDIVYKAF
jgi:hypothetical protein